MSRWIAADAEGWDPRARDGAVAQVGSARFTVLTPCLVRMEWNPAQQWEDRASLTVVNRRTPVPDFRRESDGGTFRLRTEALELIYDPSGEGFTPDNLHVRFRTGGVVGTWRPGDEPSGNLGGTVRTLDTVDGAVDVGQGVLSRDGWALVDDSATPLLEGADPRRVVGRPADGGTDWYLLAHGHDYRGALADLAAISGRIPLPPRWAFGIWWSRYWAYTDEELKALVAEFREEDVPLDVLVVDMDWHETFDLDFQRPERDAAGQLKGWTGYTWNPSCFPDPEGFLQWAHDEGLRVPLNLHPASGIQPWEDQYPEVARALKVDPATKQYIPFRAEDPDFAQAYFSHVIHPLEDQGVDFWWLDWQQGSETEVPGLTPTMWLNHLFFSDMEARGRARPVILHRFGGLGSHRYQVGFSGDAHSTWESLDFQRSFTSTASNVLFGFWSHDIGGHEPGPVDAELYARWVQFGVFSPVFRTHATKHPEAERRVWAFDSPYREAMLAAVRLRLELLPYLYTSAREAHDTGVSMTRPLYYDWPELDEAYAHPGQYMFGRDLLVHPVARAADPTTGRASLDSWLPPGAWVAWQSGSLTQGGRVVRATYAVDEVPVFIRAGAVIPLGVPARNAEATAGGPLVLWIVPGGDGAVRIYDDAGDDLGYREGACAWREVRTEWWEDGASVAVHVGAVEGDYPGMPAVREVILRLWSSRAPSVDAPCDATVTHDADEGEARVSLGALDVREPVTVRVTPGP